MSFEANPIGKKIEPSARHEAAFNTVKFDTSYIPLKSAYLP